MIDSFHSLGNSTLFQIEIISLWISQQIVPSPALILLGFDQYLVICYFLEVYSDIKKILTQRLQVLKHSDRYEHRDSTRSQNANALYSYFLKQQLLAHTCKREDTVYYVTHKMKSPILFT
jgi:hypothetical protein